MSATSYDAVQRSPGHGRSSRAGVTPNPTCLDPTEDIADEVTSELAPGASAVTAAAATPAALPADGGEPAATDGATAPARTCCGTVSSSKHSSATGAPRRCFAPSDLRRESGRRPRRDQVASAGTARTTAQHRPPAARIPPDPGRCAPECRSLPRPRLRWRRLVHHHGAAVRRDARPRLRRAAPAGLPVTRRLPSRAPSATRSRMRTPGRVHGDVKPDKSS